jgi:4-hydroxythreonine-4-phosphate dehydrogenase
MQGLVPFLLSLKKITVTTILPRIALTSGEPAGIGSDLCIQLAQYELACELIVIAEPELLLQRAKQLNLPLSINTFNAQQPVSEWLKNIKIITVIQINSWWVSCGRPVGQPVGNRDVVHRVVHGTIHSLSTTPIESKF